MRICEEIHDMLTLHQIQMHGSFEICTKNSSYGSCIDESYILDELGM